MEKINKMTSVPGVLFIFCLLIAARDAFSHRLMTDEVSPVSILLVYCVCTVAMSWTVMRFRKRSMSVRLAWNGLSGAQRLWLIKLGFFTWIVYAITIFAIRSLGAATFNLVDYGAMPICTILSSLLLVKEAPDRRQSCGALLCSAGIVVFLLVPIQDKFEWRAWVALAMVSPIATAITSAYQYELIRGGVLPEIVLLFRFPIPAIFMAVWWLAERPKIICSELGLVIIIGCLGVWLPLWILCYAFMKTSLNRFSIYLVFIPIMTYILGPLLVEQEISKILDWHIMIGAVLVLSGYIIAETRIRRDNRGSPVRNR